MYSNVCFSNYIPKDGLYPMQGNPALAQFEAQLLRPVCDAMSDALDTVVISSTPPLSDTTSTISVMPALASYQLDVLIDLVL